MCLRRMFSDPANRMKERREQQVLLTWGTKVKWKAALKYVFDYTGGLKLAITYLNQSNLFCWEKTQREMDYLGPDFHLSILHKFQLMISLFLSLCYIQEIFRNITFGTPGPLPCPCCNIDCFRHTFVDLYGSIPWSWSKFCWKWYFYFFELG